MQRLVKSASPLKINANFFQYWMYFHIHNWRHAVRIDPATSEHAWRHPSRIRKLNALHSRSLIVRNDTHLNTFGVLWSREIRNTIAIWRLFKQRSKHILKMSVSSCLRLRAVSLKSQLQVCHSLTRGLLPKSDIFDECLSTCLARNVALHEWQCCWSWRCLSINHAATTFHTSSIQLLKILLLVSLKPNNHSWAY